MDVVRVVRIVGLMLSPTAAIGAAIYVPQLVRAQLQKRNNRSASADRPSRPPIERLAADLRRLVIRYDGVRRSPQLAMRAHHLWALEAAIADCACAAADSLGVAHAPRPAHGRLPPAELHRLLRDLAEAGLVMPATMGWLAADG